MKMEIGLGKGKKNFDKRDSIAKKDQIRDAQKEFKNKNLRFLKIFRNILSVLKHKLIDLALCQC